MTHPALDVDQWDTGVPDDVVIADGYNVTVTIRDKHLVITDGTPSRKRVRRIPRISPMRSLVILGQHGYITYEAKRWLSALGVNYVEPELATFLRDPKAIRGQANQPVEVARYLIGEKLTEQIRIAESFGETKIVKRLATYFEPLADATTTITDIRSAEAASARAYRTIWHTRMILPWHPRDLATVPPQWTYYTGRRTLRGCKANDNSGASDPVNAMLNYIYTLAANASEVACRTYGMEPSLGIIHKNRLYFDAFAWDLVEPLRPRCDERVYDLIRSVEWWDQRWCHETGKGVAVLDAPVTHQLAGCYSGLLAEAMQTAKTVRDMLVGGSSVVHRRRSC